MLGVRYYSRRGRRYVNNIHGCAKHVLRNLINTNITSLLASRDSKIFISWIFYSFYCNPGCISVSKYIKYSSISVESSIPYLFYDWWPLHRVWNSIQISQSSNLYWSKRPSVSVGTSDEKSKQSRCSSSIELNCSAGQRSKLRWLMTAVN